MYGVGKYRDSHRFKGWGPCLALYEAAYYPAGVFIFKYGCNYFPYQADTNGFICTSFERLVYHNQPSFICICAATDTNSSCGRFMPLFFIVDYAGSRYFGSDAKTALSETDYRINAFDLSVYFYSVKYSFRDFDFAKLPLGK